MEDRNKEQFKQDPNSEAAKRTGSEQQPASGDHQDLESLEQKHGMGSTRKGNSSIPVDDEDIADNDSK